MRERTHHRPKGGGREKLSSLVGWCLAFTSFGWCCFLLSCFQVGLLSLSLVAGGAVFPLLPSLVGWCFPSFHLWVVLLPSASTGFGGAAVLFVLRRLN